MKNISSVILIMLLQGCTHLPNVGEPYFDYPEARGIIYTYIGNRDDLMNLADKVLSSELDVETKKYPDRIQTPYVPYSHNGVKYNRACRIKIIETGGETLRINCIRVKYEYGFQANSIHNLFTKTWWGKDASDLEQAIYLRLENEDKE